MTQVQEVACVFEFSSNNFATEASSVQIWTTEQNNGVGELVEKTSPLRPILLLSRPVVHDEVTLEECPRERGVKKNQVRVLDPFCFDSHTFNFTFLPM